MSDTLLQNAQAASQAGQFAEAARLYHEFLNAEPTHVQALYALGLIYFQSGQFDQAQYLFGEALQADPAFLDGLCMKGVTLMKLQRPDEALAAFEQALALKPDFIEALSNHATTLLELGRHRDGLEELDRVLAIDSGHVLSWNNRGNALIALNRYREAVESFDRALAIYPEFPEARRNRLYTLGELNRGSPIFPQILCEQGIELMRHKNWAGALTVFDEALAIKPGYPDVIAHRTTALRQANRARFDEIAPIFEDSLLNNLNYRGHLQVRELADRVWTEGKSALRIVDLGCGTGLAGDQFKNWAAGGQLVGIDFAARMLEEAKKRGIYDNLILGELEPLLLGGDGTYDLLIAADTLIHFGDLSAIFEGAGKCLRSGGQFIFTVESKDGEGWEETPKRRFRHSAAYLRALAARTGLVFVDLVQSTVRLEIGAPVAGFTAAVQK